MSDTSTLVVASGSQDAETELNAFAVAMEEMPKDMMTFSGCLRSLYAEKAVGTNHEAAVKFRKLRDDTRNDAIVYMRGILPKSKQLISVIKGFFEYYTDLEYEEWLECIPDLVEEVQVYRQLCEAVIKMHKDILVPLKKREDQAKLVMKELRDLSQEFEQKQKEFEISAETKAKWAKFCLLFIPFVIACPLLMAAARWDMANAVAKGVEAQTQEAAALAVQYCLTPALERFIGGLQKAAGFFALMEDELQSFESKQMKSQANPKKVHFKMMGNKAKELKSYCQMFMFALPSVTTDFQAIPTEGTDQNYVDEWLEKQRKIIEETCTVRAVYKYLKNILTTGEPERELHVNSSERDETGEFVEELEY